MLKRLQAIRHIDFEDLGFFEPHLVRAGYEIDYLEAAQTDFATIDATADLVVVLGGPMGVYEEQRYPFIPGEIAFLTRRLAAGRPTLGICLGSQLIARALGAEVYAGHEKEIGFGPISLTEAGALSPLSAIQSQPVLHWHGDTFDLPSGATLLASSAAYRHQAFAVGRNVLALQFHLEAGARMDCWLDGHAEELRLAQIDTIQLAHDAGLHSEALERIAVATLDGWLAGLTA